MYAWGANTQFQCGTAVAATSEAPLSPARPHAGDAGAAAQASGGGGWHGAPLPGGVQNAAPFVSRVAFVLQPAVVPGMLGAQRGVVYAFMAANCAD